MKANWVLESELALKAISTSLSIIEGQTPENIDFKNKGTPRDIVTELDIAVEKHIREILSSSGYQIIGEEGSKDNKLSISPDKPAWFIDPIDGTTNFISSLPFYAISAGLMLDSRFLTGAVVMPALKEIFFTMGDRGAFMNGKALKVHPASLENSLIAASISGRYSNKTARRKEYDFFGIINDKSRGCLRTGCASFNICYVASGRLQCAYGVANKLWDVAGAFPIALQAGCKAYIERVKGINEISYVVGSGGAVDTIAEMLREKKLADTKLVK
ncbi:MAG: inositol monophosphatase [Candidatus Omnitrophota bacterium]|jgi:myo-inositol-1(or 4)-monophosphatase